MPNHITNFMRVEGSAERTKELFNLIKGEEKQNGEECLIDFNKIVPMPSTLNITSSSNVDTAMNILSNNVQKLKEMLQYDWVKKKNINNIEDLKNDLVKELSEKDFNEGKIALENIEKYGHKDWYDWSIVNWGTKWNSYSNYKVSDNEISFDTAWSTPFPIIEQLAKMFPELEISVLFADEDIGSNCGGYKFHNGVLISEFLPKGWEATKFALKIKGCDDDLSVLVSEHINYVDIDNLEQSFVEDLTLVLNSPLEYVTNFLIIVKDVCWDKKDFEKCLEVIKKVALDNELYELMSEIEKVKS
jgi:hypothetical protein